VALERVEEGTAPLQATSRVHQRFIAETGNPGCRPQLQDFTGTLRQYGSINPGPSLPKIV
jgi:hypothetical protein